MLTEEDEHGLIEDVDIAEVSLPGRPAFEMSDLIRQVPVLPATLEQTVRQVDVLTVHKEVLVEQPHLIDGLTTQEAKGTADDVDTSGLVPRQMTHIITLREAEHLQSSHPRRGQSAARLWSEGSVFIMHHHTCPTRFGMSVHEVKHSTKRWFLDDGVWIKQQHIV